MSKEYFIGLDIGTESLGWAVTTPNYKLCKAKGKELWGVRLFESGKTAEERRLFRTSRRRVERKAKRIALLQELFQEEITRVDMGFYQRLKDSFFIPTDKATAQTNTIFNDTNYTDQDYHKDYPTIYHLRKKLIENNSEKADIRLLYLAVAHILKKRGHFLFEGQDFNAVSSFQNIYSNFVTSLEEELELDFSCTEMDDLENTLKKKSGVNTKKNTITQLLGKGDKQKQAFISLIAGGKVKLFDLFQDERLKESERQDIQFLDSSYEENYHVYCSILEDKISCIDYAKAVYDWSVLSNILKNHPFLSFSKVEDYEKHKADLKLLKTFIHNHSSKDVFDALFRDENNPKNYCAYTGNSKATNNKSTCTAEDLYGYIKKIVSDIATDSPDKSTILEEIEKRNFLPKQSTGDNGVIPYQLHLKELELILKNASSHHPFLLEKDENNISVEDKILQIMRFRVPYYVGPLNGTHANTPNSHAWIVKKEPGKIYPWNFQQKVDTDATAEAFIKKMTNKCTYLVGADVLPSHSILYSKFIVLNEINNIRLNGEKISVECKQGIFQNLFLSRKKVTLKALKAYLASTQPISKDVEITGVDIDIKGSMSSFIELNQILGEKAQNNELLEAIIKAITLFGDEKALIKQRLQALYGTLLTTEEIKNLAKLKYSGWGRLSKELLTEIEDVDTTTGEVLNIIDAMYETNENFMQLLANSRNYNKRIQEYNNEMNQGTNDFSYHAIMDGLYCSPAVKRGIWQTLTILQELRKIMGHDPQRVFIEVAREEGEKKRTQSRKNQLLALYRSCKNEYLDLIEQLECCSDDELRSDKLYLYFTQMGRCMYSNESISLHDLFKQDIYDIDHIYPQSKTKDDSLNNRVLVKKDLNAHVKKNLYPLPQALRTSKNIELWNRLYKMKLIEKTKFDRLMRVDGFSDEELAGFINRQLVETRQSSKAVAQILGMLLKETEIVYSKAGNVSLFRQENKLVKVRDLNDLHHAKDAYLNIVVGNVYHTKFTKTPLNFIKTNATYSLNRVYDFDVVQNNMVAWKRGKEGTIKTVGEVMATNRIFFTKYAFEITGSFSDLQPLKKGNGQMPLKTKDSRYSIKNYGGYNNISSAYFFFLRHKSKGKDIKTIEYVPIYLSKQIESGTLTLETYATEYLGLQNPQVLLPKIKKYTLFNVNGFPMHITGRTGAGLIFAPAVQLLLDEESTQYLKKVVKFNERNTMSPLKNYTVSEKSGISLEKNCALYKLFIEKLTSTMFAKRPTQLASVLESGYEKFQSITIENQCIALCKILLYFQCRAMSCDFSLVGGAANSGKIQLSKTVDGKKQIKIVNPSPTGFFSNEVDLVKL